MANSIGLSPRLLISQRAVGEPGTRCTEMTFKATAGRLTRMHEAATATATPPEKNQISLPRERSMMINSFLNDGLGKREPGREATGSSSPENRSTSQRCNILNTNPRLLRKLT